MAPRLQGYWDWRAAGNFIGGGTGAGMLAMAAAVALAGGTPRAAALAGIVCVAAGLGCVWLEIGRAWRAINVFFHPQTSWMTREAMVSLPLFALALATAWWQHTALAVAAALVGLADLHCQGHIIQAARGIPAWRTPRVLPMNFASGLTEGCGLFLALAATPALTADPHLARAATAALAVLVIARYLLWRHYRAALAGDAPTRAIEVLAAQDRWLLAAGTVLPLVLAGVAFATPAPWAAALGGVLAMLEGWHLKLVLITRASYEQGFALVHSPARGGGQPGPGAKPGWG